MFVLCCGLFAFSFRNVYINADPSEYSNVEYILLDPPCSGSGMTNRLNIFDTAENDNRLQSLAYLQGKMLAFAMQNFPNAKKIIYSTCSINVEENEQVQIVDM